MVCDQSWPIEVGGLGVFFREGVATPTAQLKRLVMAPQKDLTFPFKSRPDSEAVPVVMLEHDNPPGQFFVLCTDILAIHAVRVPAFAPGRPTAIASELPTEAVAGHAASGETERNTDMNDMTKVDDATAQPAQPPLSEPWSPPDTLDAERSIDDLWREWTIVDKQSEVDVLQYDDDEETHRILNAADDRMFAIEEELSQRSPVS